MKEELAPAPPTPSEQPKTTATADKTYFIERMKALNIDPEKVPSFKSLYTGKSGSSAMVDCPFFEPDKYGNIVINYPGLNDTFCTYEANGKIHDFKRWRKHPDNIKNGAGKYGQPASSGVQVFLTAIILEALAKEGEEIETLYLIEGEFKAWAGSQMGLHFIGITGIFNYKEKAASEPHPVIMEVIRALKPKNIVYVLDADATVAPMDAWAKDKETDLGKRFTDFYNAVTGFRTVYHHYVSGLYLVHPKPDMLEFDVKGLDDLTEWKRKDQQASAPKSKTGKTRKAIYTTNEIEEELRALPASDGKYFEVIDLARATISSVRGHFYLTRDKGGCPSYFYQVHEEKIRDAEFVFNRGRFIFDADDDCLVMIKHEDADRFIRLGTDYMKEILEPNPYGGNPERKLVKWSKSEINQDYVLHKGLKDFFKWIPKYDGPCNMPDNTDSYQLVHSNEGSKYYNLYHRISHVPGEGDFIFISNFLKHLFRDKYEMALDYLQLLYLQPTQPLPILALVSRDQHTGKSSFLNLLDIMFEENATTIGNEDLTNSFNAHYMTKLAICIDEGLVEKRVTWEKIKALSTANRAQVNTKNTNQHRIFFIGKIIFCSNNEDSFIPVDQEDSRLWVVRVNKFEGDEVTPKKRDANFLSEMPAFLHFLKNRKMVHPDKTRHWFAYDLLESETKNKLKDNSKDWLQSEVESWLKEQFLNHYLAPELYFSLDEVLHSINDNSGAKFRRKPLERLLTEIYQLDRRNSTYKQPRKVDVARASALDDSDTDTKKGRLFTFTASKFLSAAEMEELKEARKEFGLSLIAEEEEPLPGDELIEQDAF
ncbi:MAG: DUF5906 domain-containing protein [Flavobacteriales bacterium]|nr:DUF5906 domain-containing protein [Flavobacteriales bacterium]